MSCFPHRLLAILFAALAHAGAQAGEVRVAVAASFAAPLARIAEGFAAATGHTVKASSGASGKFALQVAAGAPFDVLLSADQATPRALLRQELAVAGTAFTYAVGRLALWSAQPGLVDGQGAVLASGRFRHLAMANPKVAPYGAAALEVLRARGLADALGARLVQGESVAQALQFVATGNAELGFVALSLVRVPGRPAGGSVWIVPAALHAPIRQDAVLLKAGEGNAAARALLAWLRGPQAARELAAFGYERAED